ncbi:presqualene diphosphate synthase HpnD [Alysiella filiformis]|uniref:Farnesyl-diphosphate farnesyltransferase n=1 Tax=Alysiella filiformis DSM 16848 TaxID=1120981 RepID=A0A286EE11_9NEIS|nr:presqualene diphosphate synthase HpnD [Alysiella filiformis]QMT30924.1 presqualene diphosphate synthase HpnD [Alysiella filiformis]UBQ56090.1 presqualene diphosphate synthase HpnD [Alysiella filiformis DSM 16848]SOD69142.1 farnesyl-diphosphate farnesyltransferase [Alysiella filiformis DSM 16848]
MTPFDYCEHKARESQSSFLAGFRFLPTEKRQAITVLYAFCRELDDVVDDCTDPQVAKTTLAWWRADLQKVFDANGLPEHPVQQALRQIVPKFSLPHNELEELINGMEMDLHHVRYNSFADLQYYCYRVAGVVGRLIARILGFQNAQTLEYAEKLGLALQLTNIIRDVGEDARMGRIYLPINELAQFNVPAQSILSYTLTPEFEKLMQFQVQRAQETYRQAIDLLPECDKKAQKVGLIMGGIYHALLHEIAADGVANVLRYKIKIPNPRKIRIALRVWLLGFQP